MSVHAALVNPALTMAAGATAFCIASATQQETRMVAITFDDGYLSAASVAAPVLANNDQIATAYIIDNMVRDDNPRYMRETGENSVETLIYRGWEIGGHSMTHPILTQIADDNQLRYEISGHMESMPNIPFRSFASPLGEFDNKTLSFVKQDYENHVNAWSEAKGVNTVENFDRYNVHREDVTIDVTADYVCQKLDTLPQDSLYVILMHDIVPDASAVTGEWDNPVEKLQQISDCIDAAGFETVTITQGVNRMQKLVSRIPAAKE